MPRILFIRHGETDWNAVGRFQGQKDIPLNARGRAQAERNGRVLGAAVPDILAFDFVASPLARTCETMEILRGAIGLDPMGYRTDPMLKEISFGHWEGNTESELRALWPAQIAAREADKWDFVPPGGESYADLSIRIEAWLNTVDRDTLVVSHGGVCRVLLRLIAGFAADVATMLNIRQDRVMVWDGAQIAWI